MNHLKALARERILALKPALLGLSHDIHSFAEVAFEEHQSSTAVANRLSALGFDVKVGVCGLDTAVDATYGSGSVTVGLCAEYDALPGMGHACGHNIIAAAAVGAAAGLASLCDDLDLTVRVIGTPAEEGGGGKIIMLDRGGFEGVDFAMMVHPASADALAMHCLAAQNIDVQFEGRSAHAAAYPDLGINAADAMTVAQVGIGLMRQHIRPSDRIHGIVTHAGVAPNIIPDRAVGRWIVRTAKVGALSELADRVARCFQAGATATGASLHMARGLSYAHLKTNAYLGGLYQANALQLGRKVPDLPPDSNPLIGSTDMGNVSLVIPSIHPLIGIDSSGAVNHQSAFADACINASADAAVIDGSLTLAGTAIDAALDTQLIRL